MIGPFPGPEPKDGYEAVFTWFLSSSHGNTPEALSKFLDDRGYRIVKTYPPRGLAWWGHVAASVGLCLFRCPHPEWRAD